MGQRELLQAVDALACGSAPWASTRGRGRARVWGCACHEWWSRACEAEVAVKSGVCREKWLALTRRSVRPGRHWSSRVTGARDARPWQSRIWAPETQINSQPRRKGVSHAHLHASRESRACTYCMHVHVHCAPTMVWDSPSRGRQLSPTRHPLRSLVNGTRRHCRRHRASDAWLPAAFSFTIFTIFASPHVPPATAPSPRPPRRPRHGPLPGTCIRRCSQHKHPAAHSVHTLARTRCTCRIQRASPSEYAGARRNRTMPCTRHKSTLAQGTSHQQEARPHARCYCTLDGRRDAALARRYSTGADPVVPGANCQLRRRGRPRPSHGRYPAGPTVRRPVSYTAPLVAGERSPSRAAPSSAIRLLSPRVEPGS